MTLIDKLVQMDGSKEELTSNLQKKYSSFARAGNMNRLSQLARQTKVTPMLSDKELTTLYFSEVKEGPSSYSLEQIMKWDEKAHNGKPIVFANLTEDFTSALQEGYFTLIKENNVDKENFEKLKKMTGVAVSEETVNKAYNQRIKDRHVLGDYVSASIEKATGIKPKADEKIVQDLYKECLRKESPSEQSLYFWEYIAKATKIMPEEETAQKAYRYLLKESRISELTRFAEFTGIKPNEKIVKKAYAILAGKDPSSYATDIGSKFTRDYKDLKKISGGIEPDEEIVQEAYRNIVEGNESIWDHYFIEIKELTGINPREEFVQKAYAKAIEDGQFENYEKLYNAFKVEPSAKVKKGLAKYLSS
jgi:hypothetical protein